MTANRQRTKRMSELAINDVTLRELSASETEMIASAGLGVGAHADSVVTVIGSILLFAGAGAMVVEVFAGAGDGPNEPHEPPKEPKVES